MKAHLVGVLVSLVFACAGDVLPPAPPPPPPPPPAPVPVLAIVSGNGQQGTTGEFLAEPFVVRVTNPQGAGVSNVSVSWTVVSGAGGFSTLITQTAADGVASVFFRPTTPGRITVNAWAADAVQGSPATFTVDVLGPLPPGDVLIRFGPIFDCYFTPANNDPSIFSVPEGTIPVGALVVFEYAPYLLPVCAAQVRSVSVPSGGVPFDSGIIQAGQRWGVVLDVAGDWQVRDVLNGGSAILKVR